MAGKRKPKDVDDPYALTEAAMAADSEKTPTSLGRSIRTGTPGIRELEKIRKIRKIKR